MTPYSWPPPADILLQAQDGSTLAALEVKAIRGRDSHWASQLYESRVQHELATPGLAYGIVTRDRLFFWPNGGQSSPPVELAIAERLAAYLPAGAAEPISPHAFELVVAAWLMGLTEGSEPDSSELLGQTGLAEVFEGAQVYLPPVEAA